MNINIIEKKGFKTCEIALFLTVPLEKEKLSMQSLIPEILQRGTKKYKNQLEKNRKQEELYGAQINVGSGKTGNYNVLKFYIDFLNDKYIEGDEDLKAEAIDLLKELVFNPLAENDAFNKEYVEQEKEKLRKVILSRKDDKRGYSSERVVEEMFSDDEYGAFQLGTLEDVDKINEKNLYDEYKRIIDIARMDFYIIGEDVKDIKIDDIKDHDVEAKESTHKIAKEEKVVKEQMDVSQGKLNLGLDVDYDDKFAISMYSAILGGGANSKLFQNVREKAGLAYYAGASFLRRKNAITIKSGIELENYDKALKIIKEQIEEMKKGNISDKEFDDAKNLIIASIKGLNEGQNEIITFDFDQKLHGENLSIEEYMQKIENVKKEDVIKVAQNVYINTIYFLEGEGGND